MKYQVLGISESISFMEARLPQFHASKYSSTQHIYNTHKHCWLQGSIQTLSTHANVNRTNSIILFLPMANHDENPLVGNIGIYAMWMSLVTGLRHCLSIGSSHLQLPHTEAHMGKWVSLLTSSSPVAG